MPITLYCQYCGAWQEIEGEVQPKCNKCGSLKFQTDKPKKIPYLLTVNDRRFLRSIRIKADDD